MKIYQVWEHWEVPADPRALDQRPHHNKRVLMTFIDEKRAEDYKQVCEKEEQGRKLREGKYDSYFLVKEERVVTAG
jgi:hypothetical protein